MKKTLIALLASIALALGMAAPDAKANAGTANLCLYWSSTYAGQNTDGITVWFSHLITGTPVPAIAHEVLPGECSKDKYPSLLPDKWMTPGVTSTFKRIKCESQYGGAYYSSKVYGVSLISGKLSLYCHAQWRTSSTSGWQG